MTSPTAERMTNTNNSSTSQINKDQEIEMLKKMVNALTEEINNLKAKQ